MSLFQKMPTSQSPSNEKTFWVWGSQGQRLLCAQGMELPQHRTYPAPPVAHRAVPLPAPPRAAPCPALPGGSYQRPTSALVGALGSFRVQNKHSHYSGISTKFPEALKALICLILLCKYYLSVSINFCSNSPIAEIAAVICVAFFFGRSICLWANPGCPTSVNESIY